MATVRVYPNKTEGIIKPLHGTVNGPVANHNGMGGTLEAFYEMRPPYVRLHDSSLFPNYGGEHTVDISGIFPDFERDPSDPDAYDFFFTDAYVKRVLSTGAKVLYRLGQKIEVYPKKYHVHPPKDYLKWARICEAIIRHYNEGANDGFRYGIEYWEIWNEPDNVPACWTGTIEQFYDFFEVAAKHLKSCFPHLKIGGPAFAEWSVDNGGAERFVIEMKNRGVPLDFISWHTYSRRLGEYEQRADKIRKILDENGYKDAESIVDEYNYLIDWKKGLPESHRKIITMEGAAMLCALFSKVQKAPIDKMMYYDARPCAFNGLFRAFTYDKLKAFYSLTLFSRLYEQRTWIESISDDDDVYAICAKGDRCVGLITYYTYAEAAEDKCVTISFGKETFGNVQLYLLDENHDAEMIGEYQCVSSVTVKLKANSVICFVAGE